MGEWATTTVAKGVGKKLEIHKEIHFPHSIGLLYSAFTYYTGFKVNSGEYKVMGLAPYGEPKYKKMSFFPYYFQIHLFESGLLNFPLLVFSRQ